MVVKTAHLGRHRVHHLRRARFSRSNDDGENARIDRRSVLRVYQGGRRRAAPGRQDVLNSGEFYSNTWGPENLDLLNRFFTKYPDYADRTFLSVKGAMVGLVPTARAIENLRKSVLNIQTHLGPHKKMDLYQPARIDKTRPIEDAMRNLVVLLKEGYFAHIGLSECSAETLRRANAVYPVTAAEIEVSLWVYEPETKKVIETARELGISVLAYSPIGKGFLGGKFTSAAELPEGDYRSRYTRFKADTLAHNLSLVSALPELAAKKGVTTGAARDRMGLRRSAHMSFRSLGLRATASRTLENCAAGDIELSAEEMAVMCAMAEAEVKGSRMAGGLRRGIFGGEGVYGLGGTSLE
ncbi:NADP-dependent oxidoreductase domain-containing protein [Mycena galopus ATCC 62051]|nr:NADP-dependent oxidoreductase domain-containing protein [Mycena galopus ATCC 62051]